MVLLGPLERTGAGAAPAQDEGTQVVATPTAYNFVGAGVVVSNVGGVATVTIAGGTTPTPVDHTRYGALKATNDFVATDFHGRERLQLRYLYPRCPCLHN